MPLQTLEVSLNLECFYRICLVIFIYYQDFTTTVIFSCENRGIVWSQAVTVLCLCNIGSDSYLMVKPQQQSTQCYFKAISP